jgi:hypothetical protein
MLKARTYVTSLTLCNRPKLVKEAITWAAGLQLWQQATNRAISRNCNKCQNWVTDHNLGNRVQVGNRPKLGYHVMAWQWTLGYRPILRQQSTIWETFRISWAACNMQFRRSGQAWEQTPACATGQHLGLNMANTHRLGRHDTTWATFTLAILL